MAIFKYLIKEWHLQSIWHDISSLLLGTCFHYAKIDTIFVHHEVVTVPFVDYHVALWRKGVAGRFVIRTLTRKKAIMIGTTQYLACWPGTYGCYIGAMANSMMYRIQSNIINATIAQLTLQVELLWWSLRQPCSCRCSGVIVNHQPFSCWNWDIMGWLGQYQGCWFPGSFALPSHQQPSHCPYRINKSFSSMWKDSNYLCHLSVNKS